MRAHRLARSPAGRLAGATVWLGFLAFVAVHLVLGGLLVAGAVQGVELAVLPDVLLATGVSVGLGLAAALVGVPLGIGIALWAAWLAPPRLRSRATTAVVVAGEIPPVLLAVVLLALLPEGGALAVPALVVGMALVVVPYVSRRAQQAIARIPSDDVLQAVALGARPGEAVATVVLPRALSDLRRAALTGIARTLGEVTLVVLILELVPGAPSPLTRRIVLTMLDDPSSAVGPIAALVLVSLSTLCWGAGLVLERGR